MNYKSEDQKYSVTHTPIHEWMSQQPWYDSVSKAATQRVVLPRKSNIEKSILKQDVPILRRYKNDPDYKLALQYTREYFRTRIKADLGFNENTEFNWKSSPGPSWEKLGCKTKLDALHHPEFARIVRRCHIPVFKNCAKREFKDVQEIIVDNKIRTFKVADFDFICLQKFLYDNQNKAFYEACKDPKFWCRYGFSKEYGNFHDLMARLETFYYVMTSDVSGYDRTVSCMEDWYAIRNEFIPFHVLKDFVTKYTCYSLEIDEDGYVFVDEAGNRSGSVNTTTDNCGCHVIIMFYMLIKAYKQNFGVVPTYTQCVEQGVNIMGDDNLTGLTKEFVVPDMDTFVRNIYQDFDLTVKESAFQSKILTDDDYDLSGFEFLGSTAHKNSDGFYVPIPRIDKVCSTIMYSDGPMPIAQYAQRILGLIFLCYGVHWLDELLFSILEYLITNYFQASNPELRNLYSELMLAKRSGYYKLLGYESQARSIFTCPDGWRCENNQYADKSRVPQKACC